MNDTGRAILIALLVVIALPLWGLTLMGGSGGMMGAGGGMMAGMGPGMMGGRGAGGGTSASSPPVAGAREIAVQAGELWFKPATLQIPARTPVNITLTNTGRLFHDLVIDTLDFRLGLNPGDSATGGLRVDAPGEYRFYCSVPGHAAAGMRGTLIVVESP